MKKIKEITFSCRKNLFYIRGFKYGHVLELSVEPGVVIQDSYTDMEIQGKHFRIFKKDTTGKSISIDFIQPDSVSVGRFSSFATFPFSELCDDSERPDSARIVEFLSDVLNRLDISVPQDFQEVFTYLFTKNAPEFAVFSVGDEGIPSLEMDSVIVGKFVEALASSAPNPMYLQNENRKSLFSIEKRNASGASALDIAIANRDGEACGRLIDMGILKYERIGLSALKKAIEIGYSDIITTIAIADWDDVEKQSSLNFCLREEFSKKNANIDVIGALLKSGADPNMPLCLPMYDKYEEQKLNCTIMECIDYKSQNATNYLKLLLQCESFITPRCFEKAGRAQNIAALKVLSKHSDKLRLINTLFTEEDQNRFSISGPSFW